MKTPILAALALLIGALAARAECTDHARLTCPEGQHWDAQTKSCISPSS